MSSYRGLVCITCIDNQRETPTPAGQLVLMALNPTTAILAPPNEPARVVELAAFGSEQFLGRQQSSLSGRWSLLGADDAAFGGFGLQIGPEQFDPVLRVLSYAISFSFGSGRAECSGEILGCRIYLRFSGLDHEFLLFEIPYEGVGNQRLYTRDGSGRWRSVMVRMD